MSTWQLKTNQNPLAVTRLFIQNIWPYADLDGMLIPVYQPGQKIVKMTLIYDPEQILAADPFVPLMQVNAAKMVTQLAREHPKKRYAAVLRACEIRALAERLQNETIHLENWLVIGVDCLSCFPAQDFEWRVEKAGGVEQLTHEVLRNARQGGIALDRFRSACQMCSRPDPTHVDLCIDLLGLPVSDVLLINARNEAFARRLNLNHCTDGSAPRELLVQRADMLIKIEERRERIRERQLRELTPEMPINLDQLVSFLQDCQPCKKCLEACPVHAEELIPAIESGHVSQALAERWLMSCAECGMCEQACPKDVPLAAIMTRIHRNLQDSAVAV